jgi:hypothetical protein
VPNEHTTVNVQKNTSDRINRNRRITRGGARNESADSVINRALNCLEDLRDMNPRRTK